VPRQEQHVVVGEPGEPERIWLIHETPLRMQECVQEKIQEKKIDRQERDEAGLSMLSENVRPAFLGARSVPPIGSTWRAAKQMRHNL
jgi:hypothetical protein